MHYKYLFLHLHSIVPNCIAKKKGSQQLFVGDELDSKCENYAQLMFKRPHDKGYLLDCETQAAIWKRIFSADMLNVKGAASTANIPAPVQPQIVHHNNQLQQPQQPQQQQQQFGQQSVLFFGNNSASTSTPSTASTNGFEDTRLVLSHPAFQPQTIQRDTNEMVFEYFGFGSFLSLSSSMMCAVAMSNSQNHTMQVVNNNNAVGTIDPAKAQQLRETKAMLIVDSGFSFSHIVPIVGAQTRKRAVRRINIGGKALTNYLKEIVSIRQYDMTEETHLMNVIKERMCVVSLDFLRDLKITSYHDSRRNIIRQRYVLPDYTNGNKLGFVKKSDEAILAEEQIMTMNNERITVPELLFHPSDIGLNQAGIAETVVQAVEGDQLQQQQVPSNGHQQNSGLVTDDEEKQLMYDSVVLVGGNTQFKNFKQRFTTELRSLMPEEYDLTVLQPAKYV